MKNFWSGEETRRGRDELFRVKVVGSNPADPTTTRAGPAKARIFRTLGIEKRRPVRGHAEGQGRPPQVAGKAHQP